MGQSSEMFAHVVKYQSLSILKTLTPENLLDLGPACGAAERNNILLLCFLVKSS